MHLEARPSTESTWAKTSFAWSGPAGVLNSAAMAGQKAASDGTHRIIPTQFVKPNVKSNRNETRDFIGSVIRWLEAEAPDLPDASLLP
jgi:hypothetical protein